jgi:heme A synthase
LAYLLLILVIFWLLKAQKIKGNVLFNKTRFIPAGLILLQVILGILTVTLSPYGNNLVWFGVAHQLVAMLFLMSIILMLYLIRSNKLLKGNY